MAPLRRALTKRKKSELVDIDPALYTMDPAALEALMRSFVECRIKPYYLHHGDLAPGTSHLRTTLSRGQEIMRALRGLIL